MSEEIIDVLEHVAVLRPLGFGPLR